MARVRCSPHSPHATFTCPSLGSLNDQTTIGSGHEVASGTNDEPVALPKAGGRRFIPSRHVYCPWDETFQTSHGPPSDDTNAAPSWQPVAWVQGKMQHRLKSRVLKNCLLRFPDLELHRKLPAFVNEDRTTPARENWRSMLPSLSKEPWMRNVNTHGKSLRDPEAVAGIVQVADHVTSNKEP